MRWTTTRYVLAASIVAAGLTLPTKGETASVYRVRVGTAEFTGSARKIALDLVSGAAPVNCVLVGAFSADGKRGITSYQGGPVSGGLVDGVGPLEARIQAASFYNQLAVGFDSTGATINFDVQLSENVASGSVIPDELSFYLLNQNDTGAFPTVDPFGTNALFAIDVTGASGGDLRTFAPMQFVAPDTLRMTNSTVDVPASEKLLGRLRLRSLAPNPARDRVALTYDIPAPGGLLRIRVFDVAGRIVSEAFSGERQTGTWTTVWRATDMQGRRLRAGVYILHLQMAGQSVVRRVVLQR